MPALHARPSEEPGAVIPHAGICEGGAGQPASLPQLQEMKIVKIIRWCLLGLLASLLIFVAAVFHAIGGPKPSPVEGTDRPEWLPPTASNVFHRSQEGFGWWKVAEFSITETELRAYATERGWAFHEELNYIPPGQELLKPPAKPYTDKEFRNRIIPRALVYQRLASNNGGVTIVFDPSKSSAYYLESHR